MHKLFHNFKEACIFAKEQAIKTSTLHTIRRNGEEWTVFNKNNIHLKQNIEKKLFKRSRYSSFLKWDYEKPIDPEEARLSRLARTRKTGQEASWRQPKAQIAIKSTPVQKGSYILCRTCGGNGCIKCDCTGWAR